MHGHFCYHMICYSNTNLHVHMNSKTFPTLAFLKVYGHVLCAPPGILRVLRQIKYLAVKLVTSIQTAQAEKRDVNMYCGTAGIERSLNPNGGHDCNQVLKNNLLDP